MTLCASEVGGGWREILGDSQGAPGFSSPSRLTVSKALVRSTKAAYRTCSVICISLVSCLSMKIMSTVPLLDLNPHWLSGVFSCAIVGMSLLSKTRAKILPTMESRRCLVSLKANFSPLFLYRETVTASMRSCGRVPFSRQLVN